MVRSIMRLCMGSRTNADREIGDHICLLSRIHVLLSLVVFQRPPLTIIRYWKQIPDPLLGPKGVRTLLVFRGLTGCESL